MYNVTMSILCLAWFGLCWFGYTSFAKRQAKKTHCISSVMHRHRISWMTRLLYRDHFIADTSLLASLARQVTFFASTTMLILAGLLTVFSASERLFTILSSIPGLYPATLLDIQVRLMILVVLFIYAFFTFTWSMRQYAFCSVLMGACPHAPKGEEINEINAKYIKNLAKIIDQAGHSYNYGLRSYYFALSMLAWFIHPFAFVFATTIVVVVLFKREFHSHTLLIMNDIDTP